MKLAPLSFSWVLVGACLFVFLYIHLTFIPSEGTQMGESSS